MLTIETRLQLLLDSGQIDVAAHAATRAVVALVEGRYRTQVTEDNGAQFVTHLAVALARLRRGEGLCELPQAALSEAREYPVEWEFVATAVGEQARRLDVTLPTAEIAYLTLHLAALLTCGGAA
jgi:transcriptional antiterminator